MPAKQSRSPVCKTCGLVPYATRSPESILTPELRKLLHFSYAPTDVQLSQVQSIVEDIGQDRESLQARIACLSAHLTDLKRQDEQLSRLSDQCRSVSSPMRILPLEIYHKIFSYACVSEKGWTSLEHHHAPFILSGICKYWREIVVSQSNLWSTIRINMDPKRPARGTANNPDIVKHRDVIMRRFILCLERSGSRPLDVTFGATRLEKRTPKLHRDLCNTLARAAGRLRSLKLELALPQFSLLLGLARHLTSLQSLDINLFTSDHYWYQASEDDVANAKVDLFEVSPQLRTLRLRGAMENPCKFFSLPWSQLTDVQLDPRDMFACRALTSQAESLRLCHLQDERRYGSGPLPAITSTPKLSYSSLTTLVLEGSELIRNASAYFSLAALEVLVLIFDTTVKTRQIQSVIGLVQQTQSSLRALCLSCNNEHFQPEVMSELLSLLRSASGLKTLALGGKPWIALLEAISMPDNMLLPSLQRLSIFAKPGSVYGHNLHKLADWGSHLHALVSARGHDSSKATQLNALSVIVSEQFPSKDTSKIRDRLSGITSEFGLQTSVEAHRSHYYVEFMCPWKERLKSDFGLLYDVITCVERGY